MRYTKRQMYEVIVIGGGAAGMLASATAAERGLSVLLLEHNEVFGKKLRITGKGRCNLTNDCTVRDVLENIPTGGRFLQSVLTGFTPQDAKELFEELGVPLKVERGRRVFPVSDKAEDVVNALVRYMDNAGVLRKQTRALGITVKDGAVTGVRTQEGVFRCRSVIVCTGGKSYPGTGSTGDGYKMAAELGHTITQQRGSLVPLAAEPEVCRRMQGLTLKNVRLSVYAQGSKKGGKKPVFEEFGELLFTHFGISGPLALSASAHMRDFIGERYYAVIDLKPALDEKKLDLRILRDFNKNINRDYSNALGGLLNRLMIPVIVEKTGIRPETKVHSITREQRRTLLEVIKRFEIEITGPRPVEEAVVTSGGIELREINPKTMESKVIRGLYFAGEVIDADGYTGGYNLQIAWSTARAAGKSAN